MEITKVHEVLEAMMGDNLYGAVSEYGEPGYSHRYGATTPLVVLGDYWCRCGRVMEDDPCNPGEQHAALHEFEHHHPRIWAQLESQGVAFEWSDEWHLDYENDKAWRTQPDSYSWQPSIILPLEACEYITPDDDIETWIEACVNNPSMCVPRGVWSDAEIEATGFVEYQCGYENGWHPGQTDDPREITRLIREERGDDVEILFQLTQVQQFDISFCVWVRDPQGEEEVND